MALVDPVALTVALAEIDSVNPSLMAGAAGERAVADFVAEWCRSHGLDVSVTEAAPGRPNVVAVRRGSGGGRSVLLNGHLDTVGATGPDTMTVTTHGGRLVGRGVLDMKGGLACALAVAASIEEGELAGDVIVAAVADEEYASIGTEALVREWSADAAIVLEPTQLEICARHRGFAVVAVTCTGSPAHTSRPDRGANAVHAAARVIAAIGVLDERWAADEADITARPLTLASGITSGSETFTVPPHCTLTVEVRTTAADPTGQVDEVRRAIESAAGGGVAVTAEVVMSRSPLGVAADHPLVTTLQAAAHRATGDTPPVVGAPFWTDAALHAEAGTPAVVFGPVGEGLHEDVEWVSTDSLRRCVATLDGFVRDWCA